MSQTPDSRDTSLPFAIQEQIDAICDRFEAAWKAGDNPRLEEYLDEVPEPARAALLSGLLAVEIEYRQDAEGNCVPDDLILAAHPELSEAVAEALEKLREPDATASHTPDAADAPASDSIPGYTLLKELNRGGQGVVYQAIQKSTHRKVALKVMLEGPFAGPDSRHRFEREVALVGSLRHPNIVPVFDSGVAQGRFFYAMEYVRGKSLMEYVQSEQLSLEQTLRLFKKVCDAVNCAHQRGVIHRDLKPTNILVDNTGEPHILDFGLAKVGGAEVDGDSRSMLLSVTGQVIGTLPYMCPEQAAGRPDEIDMRSDVYALGVILYELLTGTYPYDVKAQMADVLANILKAEPRRPSTISRQINDEVETIILKTLSKEKERRYDTAGALGRDIEHYLSGEPIDAKRDSALYVLRKTLRRYKVHAGVAAGFVVLVTAAAIAMSVMYAHQRSLSEERDAALVKAQANEKTARAAEAEALDAQRATEDAHAQTKRSLYVSDMNVALQAWHDANIVRMESLLKRHVPSVGEDDLRGFDWYYLWRLGERGRHADIISQPGRARSIDVSPRNDLLAAGCADGLVFLWDLQERQLLQTFRKPRDTWRVAGVYDWERPCIAFSPDGEILAYPSEDYEKIILYSLGSGGEEVLDGEGVKFQAVTFSPPDGRYLATRSVDLSMKLWDLRTGTSRSIPSNVVAPPTEHYIGTDYYWGVVGLAFDRNGKRLATGNADKSIDVWDIDTLESLGRLEGRPGRGWTVAFSPDPNREVLAIGSTDGKVTLWDLATKDVTELEGHKDEVRSVAFSPGGEFLATGSRDNTAILWDTATLRKIESLKGHSHNVESLDFWQDGDTLKLVTGSSDRTVKCWVVGQTKEDALSLGQRVRELELSPNGKLMACRQHGPQEVTVWELDALHTQPTPINVMGRASSIAVSTKFLAVGVRGEVQLWSLDRLKEAGEPLKCKTRSEIVALTFSPPNSEILAAGSEDGHVMAWDVMSGTQLFDVSGHAGIVSAVNFTPSGDVIASASRDCTVKLWEISNGDEVKTISASEDHVMSVAFSNNAEFLASGGYDNTLKLWRDWRPGETAKPRTLVGHSDGILSIMFPPDGRTAITGCGDCSLKVWDISTRQERLTLNEHTSAVACAALSLDGTLLVSGSRNGNIRFWRAATEAEVRASGYYGQ